MQQNVKILLIFLFALILGCSSAPTVAPSPHSKQTPNLHETLEEIRCEVNELKGYDVAENFETALGKSRAQISLQVQSSIENQSELIQKMVQQNGMEYNETYWENLIRQNTKLLNAQDARVVFRKMQNGETGVVACMSKSDAAKPYLVKINRLSDSLELFIGEELSQNHPLKKKNAFIKSNELYANFLVTSQIIQTLGAGGDNQANIEYKYRSMQDDFKNFRSKYEFILQIDGTQIGNIITQKLSSRYKLSRTGECESGLGVQIKQKKSKIECSPSSFGETCYYELVLLGGSCDNVNEWFVLREVIKANDSNAEFAKKRLLRKLENDSFWNAWFFELDKWSM
ncbi:hypothetical protein AGMMS49938_17620 [Fibrobacterales bacterium]|nr:hypothetical protein AGMMS49938_17620 [Fibrobacterales bacterium]